MSAVAANSPSKYIIVTADWPSTANADAERHNERGVCLQRGAEQDPCQKIQPDAVGCQ